MGIVTSSITSLIFFLPLPFILPFVQINIPSVYIVLMAFLAGIFIQASQAFYFVSLSYTEAGIVAAYWNMVPAMVTCVSFIRKELIAFEYFGILLIIIASTWICILDYPNKSRVRTFFYMFLAALLQSSALMLEDVVYQETSFLTGFIIVTSGLVFTGLVPFIFKKSRRLLKKNFVKIYNAKSIFIGIEVLNLFALFTSQMAINLGIPSLVAAVEATIPGYTFGLSMLFSHFNKTHGSQNTSSIYWKILCVLQMVLGVWLIAHY